MASFFMFFKLTSPCHLVFLILSSFYFLFLASLKIRNSPIHHFAPNRCSNSLKPAAQHAVKKHKNLYLTRLL